MLVWRTFNLVTHLHVQQNAGRLARRVPTDDLLWTECSHHHVTIGRCTGLILLFCCVGQLRPIRSQYDCTLANERADLGDEEGPEEGNSPLVRSDHIRSWVFVYVQVRRFETKQQSKMRNYLVLSIKEFN